MLQSLVSNKLLNTLDKLAFGSLKLVTPDGRTYHFEGGKPGPEAEMEFHDWAVIRRMMTHGNVGLTEDYRDGNLETPNLTNLLLLGLENQHHLDGIFQANLFSRSLGQLRYMLFDRNTLKGSKRNIHAHYDLGNDFYRLWLDPGMTYSSALYQSGEEGIEEAQDNKYDRILDRLDINTGRLLEIGCGWGGFAQRSLDHHDIDYKGLTLSSEQQSWAVDRLDGRQANVALEDYRIQKGKYDYLVSIEMFEAVGQRYWQVYFSKLKELLAERGRAVVQTITIADGLFDRYRRSADMIRSFIFPGGMLPSPSRFDQQAEKAGLQVVDRFDFGQDYARTLRVWLNNFENVIPQLNELGFDEKFQRVWRFYLAGCIATFETGRTSVQQMELRHA